VRSATSTAACRTPPACSKARRKRWPRSRSPDHPILSQLSSLNQKLGKLPTSTGLQAVLDCMEPARIQLQEAVYALNDYLDRVDLDPARLHQVEARMDAIHGTARKFRVTEEQLPEEHAKLSVRLRSWPMPATWKACASRSKNSRPRTWKKRSACRKRAPRPRAC
jgi:hypothetical protein